MEPGGVVMVVLVVGLIVFAVVNRSRYANSNTGALSVSGTPEDAINGATTYMVQRGFALSHKSETSATFTRPKKANNDIGCLLLLLGIIPGLLYFGLFKGTATTTVLATSGPAGTQLIVSGDDANARRTLRDWAKETLAVPSESHSEPCWKCGETPSEVDVRCPSCGAWLRPQS